MVVELYYIIIYSGLRFRVVLNNPFQRFDVIIHKYIGIYMCVCVCVARVKLMFLTTGSPRANK